MGKASTPGPEHEEGAWYKRLTRGAPLAVLLATGLFVAYQALPVLEVIAVAMLIAFVIRTVLHGVQKLGARPWLSVTVLLITFGAFGAFIWLVVVPNLVRETQMLISQAPSYIGSLADLVRSVPFIPDSSWLADRLQGLFSYLVNSLPSLMTNTAWMAGEVVATLFLALYMSINPAPLVSGALRLVPMEEREKVRGFLRTFEFRLRGWIVGTAVISAFIGVGAGAGLWILGVPLPVTFGLLVGVLNVVPYLGSTVGTLLPALVALTISPVKALLVVVLFVILNQIEGSFLQPLVMARQAQMHPAKVLISLLVLGALLGLAGVLLAVPAAVFLTTLVDELSSRGSSQEETEAEGGPGNSQA